MPVSTYRVKRVWLRRLFIVCVVICIPGLILWEILAAVWRVLAGSWDELRTLHVEIAKQWRKDYRR